MSLYTLPHHVLDGLVQGLPRWLEGSRPDEAVIFLPTRRACQRLATMLADHHGGACLLPTLLPLNDHDGVQTLLLQSGYTGPLPGAAMDGAQRQMLLARCLRDRIPSITTQAQALLLADDLLRLNDQRIKQGLSPDALSDHWSIRQRDNPVGALLKVLAQDWPSCLVAHDLCDPTTRERQMLLTLSDHWQATPPDHPVLIVGSTGSLPATRVLMQTVMALPHGAVILPGLERDLPDTTWHTLPPTHPQATMKLALEAMGMKPRDVALWPGGTSIKQAAPPPARLISNTRQQEAEHIALLMRQAAADPSHTLMVVTPDRGLAQRIKAVLKRWGLTVPDSGGTPLLHHPVGVWLMAVLRLARAPDQPAIFFHALKNALAAAGDTPEQFATTLTAMEKRFRLAKDRNPTLSTLDDYFTLALHTDADATLYQRVVQTLAPIRDALATGHPFNALLKTHIQCAEALATTATGPGAQCLWRNAEAAVAVLRRLLTLTLRCSTAQVYADTLTHVLQAASLPDDAPRSHLSILGPLEARLLSADTVILAGLNAGVWTSSAPDPPWLPAAFRHQAGLPDNGWRTGLAAHDFWQLLHAGKTVILTHARRIGRSPAMACEWLAQLDMQLREQGTPYNNRPVQDLAQWHAAVFQTSERQATHRPAPCPPVSSRPRRVSVTDIETWMRDPYALYAKHILKLRPLQPLQDDPDARDLGTILHTVLERVVKRWNGTVPDKAWDDLCTMIGRVLGRHVRDDALLIFWQRRLQGACAWFLDLERDRCATPLALEQRGQMTINDDFLLTCTADRIDQLRNGDIAIIDYKTGQPPTKTDVVAGLSNQLTLAALMLADGGFPDRTHVADCFAYWHLSGGKTGGNVVQFRNTDKKAEHHVQRLVEEARAGLVTLVTAFDDPATPYLCRPRHDARPRFSDVEQLARVKAWENG